MHALSILFAASVVGARGQVLDEPHPLRDLHLLLFSQLAGGARHVRRRVVDRRVVL